MVRYDGYDVVFQEVPGEVTLALNITGCQGQCEGCHSPWLREVYGQDVLHDLPGLLERYQSSVTCVCFMGEGNDPLSLSHAVELVKQAGLKTCIYSGADVNRWELYHTDYFKYGSYQTAKGGLNSPSTNQRFLSYTQDDQGNWLPPCDLTYLFQKEKE